MDRVNALFGAGASAERLLAVAERLERLAVAAEAAGSSNAVAQLAAQQLRGVEVGARLAGAGGYAPGKGPGEGASPGAQFSVNIHIGGERVVSVRAALDGQHVETAAD
ncbi:hypothetical protein [Muricoccus pecuniae]|uniref:Uncharacterized protein n=1 Tax=Muricoccus pecuniae TaxID=693023 RepID=A0A840XXL2_9PROT|nr:hypothetical protein [Roseomonas pecuniae]MBB5693528.1 hypothetical protein [Roseomonas pecuniae]